MVFNLEYLITVTFIKYFVLVENVMTLEINLPTKVSS